MEIMDFSSHHPQPSKINITEMENYAQMVSCMIAHLYKCSGVHLCKHNINVTGAPSIRLTFPSLKYMLVFYPKGAFWLP
jgi:hypothetical protein